MITPADEVKYLGQIVDKEIVTKESAQFSVELDENMGEVADGARVTGVSANFKPRFVQGRGDLVGRLVDGRVQPAGDTDVFRDRADREPSNHRPF